MVSPAKSAHTILLLLTQALLLSATGWKAMLVPGDAMKISTQCEEYVCRPDVKVGFDAANTVGVSAPERYVSAQACRMMLEGRTHQPVSYDVSAVSFRAWLERDVRVKPPKDFRLSDDWLRYVMKAFLLLSPGASRESANLRRILRWWAEGVHRATSVECVECSVDLLKAEGARMSSKSSPWITGRNALELLTTAETATSRRAAGLVCISDRTDLTSNLQRESLPRTCRS